MIRVHAVTAAAACFLATATTGCVYQHGDNAVIESHFTRLDQNCFGYEPTVWRTMSGECNQAVRQIPEPVIRLPKAVEEAPKPATEPKPSVLESVPEPGQESSEDGGIGILNGIDLPKTPQDNTTPPTEPAPDTATPQPPAPAEQPKDNLAPADAPTTPAPAAESTPAPPPAETPAEGNAPATEPSPPQVDPTAAPPAEPPKPQFSRGSTREILTVPVSRQTPEDKVAAPKSHAEAADHLFRTLESALRDAPHQTPAPKTAAKKGPTGLAKFISY